MTRLQWQALVQRAPFDALEVLFQQHVQLWDDVRMECIKACGYGPQHAWMRRRLMEEDVLEEVLDD